MIWHTLQNLSDLTNSSCNERQILVFFLQIIRLPSLLIFLLFFVVGLSTNEKKVKYWPFSLEFERNVFGRVILVFFFSLSCFRVPPLSQCFFPEGFRVREFFWAPQSVSQKLPWTIDPSWLQRHGVNWNSLPVSIRSSWIKSDVSTVISFYLDFYIIFLQITFLFTANRLNKPF